MIEAAKLKSTLIRIQMLVLTLLVSLLPLLRDDALAGEHSAAAAKSELAFLTGYGITHRSFGATRTQVQTWDAIARFGYFLTDEVGKGHWYQGRHQVLVELPYHMAVDYNARSMVGGYLLGSWKFTGLKEFAPYVFAGREKGTREKGTLVS